MPPHELFAFATIGMAVIASFCVAANDAATGAAGIVASGTTDLRTALLIAAFGCALGLLVLDAGTWARILGTVLPVPGSSLQDRQLCLTILFAAMTSLALTSVLTIWLGIPTPLALSYLVALATVAGAAGLEGNLSGVLRVAAGALGGFAMAALCAALALQVIRSALLRYARPRDRLPFVLPAVVALATAMAGLAAVLAFRWAAGHRPPAWGTGAVLLLMTLAAGGWVWYGLHSRAGRFTNDGLGAEMAFRQWQIGGGAILAVLHGAAQLLPIALTVGLAIALSDTTTPVPRDWSAMRPWFADRIGLPFLVVAAAGATLAGHRSSQFLAERLGPTAAAGGQVINLGAQAGTLAGLLMGLPVAGNQAAAGGFLGLSLALRRRPETLVKPMLRLLTAWTLGPLLAAVLGLAAWWICRALMG